jgi:hypothetical protein
LQNCCRKVCICVFLGGCFWGPRESPATMTYWNLKMKGHLWNLLALWFTECSSGACSSYGHCKGRDHICARQASLPYTSPGIHLQKEQALSYKNWPTLEYGYSFSLNGYKKRKSPASDRTQALWAMGSCREKGMKICFLPPIYCAGHRLLTNHPLSTLWVGAGQTLCGPAVVIKGKSHFWCVLNVYIENELFHKFIPNIGMHNYENILLTTENNQIWSSPIVKQRIQMYLRTVF